MNVREGTKRKDACLNAESPITCSQRPWPIPANRRCDFGYFSSRSISTVWGGTQPQCGKSSRTRLKRNAGEWLLRREMMERSAPSWRYRYGSHCVACRCE
jgi:hypothetical protein